MIGHQVGQVTVGQGLEVGHLTMSLNRAH